MVDVVFSDSEKGAMKCGQRFSNSVASAIATVVFQMDGESLTQEEYDAALIRARRRQERQLKNGKSLGGNPEDVHALSFALDIGNIASPVADVSRRELLTRMLSANPWDKLGDMEESIQSYWNNRLSDLSKLMMKAKSHEPIRIWYSHAPYSMCGLYDTLYQLKDYDCSISVIRLPDWVHFEEEARALTSWSEISPGEFVNYLPLESKIPDSVKKAMISEWEKLKQENAPLRVVLNGKLHSAESDFYDSFIRQKVPDGPFKVCQLIGWVLGEEHLGIGDWLIAQRIQKMIEANELIVTKENVAFYGTTLKRNR